MDELDSLLDAHAELEARFKELEDRVDLEELKAEAYAEMRQEEHQRKQGQSPPSHARQQPYVPQQQNYAPHEVGQTVEIDDGPSNPRPQQRKAERPKPPPPKREPPKPKKTEPPKTADPTAALKARLQGREDVLFLVVLCPNCGGKNRTRLDRLRTAVPRCGRCGGDLTRHR